MDILANLLVTNCIPEEYVYLKTYPCPCGATGYEPLDQLLLQPPNGRSEDVLNGQCRACGIKHEFRFDVSHSLGKFLPEKPSELFDVVEWIMYLFHIKRIPLTGEEGSDFRLRMEYSMAVEQALLFFDEGVETPRPDAFFHTPQPPKALRPYLSRRFLEPLQARIRADMGRSPGPAREQCSLVRTDDGTLYHSECLPEHIKEMVQLLDATMEVAPPSWTGNRAR